MAKVAVLYTDSKHILEDYRKLLELIDYKSVLDFNIDTLIKLNLSWTKYFPACSTQPWQLEGLVKTLLEDGFPPDKLLPIENKTVVTNPIKGARNNLWLPILKKYALTFESISLRSIPPCVLTLHATEYDFSINSMFQRIVIHLETVNNFDDPCSYNALLQWLKEIRGFCPKKNRYENRGHPPIKNDVTDRSNSGDIMPKE